MHNFACQSEFRFYYSNTQDENPPEMSFPVVNMSEAMIDGENPEGEEDGGFLQDLDYWAHYLH